MRRDAREIQYEFRYDHPDALLTFLMLLAAYGVQRAIEKGGPRWLALAGNSLGLDERTSLEDPGGWP